MPSHAITLRDTAFEIITALGTLRTVRVVPSFQWQPEDQSACGVYLLRTSASADGDAATGEPHFENTATIGISILVRSDGPETLLEASDAYVDEILGALLQSPEWVALSRGISGYTRAPTFNSNGSAYMVETRIEITVEYQERWEPVITDDYLRTRMTTKFTKSPDAPTIVTIVDEAKS